MYVTNIDNGDNIKVQAVDFGKGAKKFEAKVATTATNAVLEIHLDSPAGTLIGSLKIKSAGSTAKWDTQLCTVSKQMGLHDVYFVFKGAGSELFNFDWWQFSK